MKDYEKMTKTELIERLRSFKKEGSPGSEEADLYQKTLHDLQVHQIELKMQNRELRETQQMLELSRDQYRALYDDAPVAYVTLDDKGAIQRINTMGSDMLGMDRAHLIGMPFSLYVARGDLKNFLDHLRRCGDANMSMTTDLTLAPREGVSVKVEMSTLPIQISGMGSVFYRTTITDITERTRMEDELRSSLSLLYATLEATGDGILAVDREGRIVTFNKLFSEIWHLPIPDNILELKEDNESLMFILGQLKTPEVHIKRALELYKDPDKEHFDILELNDGRVFECRSKPQLMENKIVGRVLSFHDITDRRRAEEALLHAQKMEVVGQLAGGIAHDFNNIIQVIMGYASILKMELPEDGPLWKSVDRIIAASKKASELTRGILAFGRKQTVDLKSACLNHVIEGVDDLVEKVLRADIKLKIDLTDDAVTVMADRLQIEQVIINLAANARDAMPHGGLLEIKTERVAIDDKIMSRHGNASAGTYAVISMTDSGSGMDDSTRKKIFEPFFTTKGVGKGTGLGLSTVYAIVQQHKGFINVYSETGKGTCFKIYLPATDALPHKEKKSKEVFNPVKGTETLLLAEDDEDIRVLTKSFIERFGYKVIDAGDGEAALNAFRNNKDDIRLAILDTVMPKMNGREVREEIVKISPDMKVLFMSGYTAGFIEEKGILGKGFHFLPKPVSPSDLLNKVREMLDGKGR